MENTLDISFNRSKIYEKLDYHPQPEGYNKSISWIVQNQIAATNGIHYIDRIGKLDHYPIFELPVQKVTGQQLMLDIGSGWGRWLIAGANKGYIPVGIDLRLEFCETQQLVLKELGLRGYSVVADLENIPFADHVFNLVWSFSVLQHVHKKRLMKCIQHIDRILASEGFIKVELPNKKGIRNRMLSKLVNNPEQEEFNSWCVRYYTLEEYEQMFQTALNNPSFSNHSVLGIGVLKEDLRYVSWRNKILCAGSLLLSGIASVASPVKHISDSVYLQATKKSAPGVNNHISQFFKTHFQRPHDNLNIVSLLRCPITGDPVELSPDRKKVISRKANICYPVVNDIPVMVASESVPL